MSGFFFEIRYPTKHQSEFMTGFEHNPCLKKQDIQAAISNSKFDVRNKSRRRDTRYSVPMDASLFLRGHSQEFRVIEFSLFGFKVISNSYLAKGCVVELKVDLGIQELDDILSEKLLNYITVEVRWSRVSGKMFEHGLLILGDGLVANNFRLSILGQHPNIHETKSA